MLDRFDKASGRRAGTFFSRAAAPTGRRALFLPAALAVLLVCGAAFAAEAPLNFAGLSVLPPTGNLQSFRLEFGREPTLRVHDELNRQHLFYLDYYNVASPGADRDWTPAGDGVFRIKQIYYADQRVLRFVFYCRGDAWFAVQTRGGSIHEVQVRPIGYRPLAAAGAGTAPPAEAGSRKRIVIDPGHGGIPGQGKYHLGGKTSVRIDGRFVFEEEVTLAIAGKLEGLLKRTPNIDTVMTRSTNVYVSLEDRIDLARKAHGDLFLSIHTNESGSSSKTARGFEVYYLSDGSKETNRELLLLENEGVDLGNSLSYQESLRDVMKQLANEAMGLRQAESQRFCESIDAEFKTQGPWPEFDRGVKSAPFRVLMNFEMPAALAECGFLDNPEEGRQLCKPEFQDRIAALLFNAINRYFAMEDPDFRPARIEIPR
jgi:N-acetylmuramoyl-L-alanine amidase